MRQASARYSETIPHQVKDLRLGRDITGVMEAESRLSSFEGGLEERGIDAASGDEGASEFLSEEGWSTPIGLGCKIEAEVDDPNDKEDNAEESGADAAVEEDPEREGTGRLVATVRPGTLLVGVSTLVAGLPPNPPPDADPDSGVPPTSPLGVPGSAEGG